MLPRIHTWISVIIVIASSIAAEKICDPVTEYCVELNKCTQLYEEVQQANKSAKPLVFRKLKKLICGYQGTMSMVCCPVLNGIENHPSINLLNTLSCGSSGEDRISKGNITGLFDYPWMALLKYDKDEEETFECGGTFINDLYVLTAAHCITNLGSKRLTHVRVGEHDLEKNPDCQGPITCAEEVEDIGIELAIPHENYNTQTFVNDIALLRLKKKLRREAFEPICLPINSELMNKSLLNKNATIAGWGTTENTTTSSKMLHANIPVISNEQCYEALKKSIQGGIADTHVCAGGTDGVIACRGDSGGPLKFKFKLNEDSKFVQYGIVSFGARKCGANLPGVYTRIPPYMNWILNKLKP